MSRIILVLLVVASCMRVNAQLSVSDLELQWKNIFEKGQQALDDNNNQEAEKHFRTSLNLLYTNNAKYTLYHIYSLIKLGEIYYSQGATHKMSNILSEILDIRSEIRPGSKSFINYLYNLSIFYSNIGNFIKAEEIIIEALQFDAIIDTMDGMRSRLLHRLALCQYSTGNVKEAAFTEKECINNDLESNSEYSNALLFYYYKMNAWEKLDEFLPNCFNQNREATLRIFAHSKKDKRSVCWSTASLFFTDFIPSYLNENPSNILKQYAYNSALFSKGILLAAENKSIELTLKSNNPELIKTYDRFLKLKDMKSRTFEEDIEVQTLSDVFLRYQKEHKNEFREDFRIDWKEIQRTLKDEDIAIEFITIPLDNGQVKYAALCLKKDYKVPHFIELGILTFPDDIYLTHDLYNKIWGSLKEELSGTQNIYFSPIGELCNVAIEYLPDELGGNIFIEYNTYRLSSTKELVNNHFIKYTKPVLFGGINYDTDITQLSHESNKIDRNINKHFHNVDSIEYRTTNSDGGVSFLPGTLREVEQIRNILHSSGLTCSVFTGENGTETALKKFSGADINILHIATHGFYYANKNLGHKNSLEKVYRDLNLHLRNDGIIIVNEDKMLTRSGLLLSGVNNVLRRISIPNNIDDGILYADEISNTDLSNVNLLVLSACQSGLGDLVSSEGVFGLQRGFKLAGVKSIIMSLWKVDDKATEILMTNFYDNLTKGQNIREALMNAQLYLRTISDGRYDSPEYWAAFILLDGFGG